MNERYVHCDECEKILDTMKNEDCFVEKTSSIYCGDCWFKYELNRLELENNRLRKALDFYADNKKYDSDLLRISNYRYLRNSYTEPEILNDGGTVARKSLGLEV